MRPGRRGKPGAPSCSGEAVGALLKAEPPGAALVDVSELDGDIYVTLAVDKRVCFRVYQESICIAPQAVYLHLLTCIAMSSSMRSTLKAEVSRYR